MGSITSSRTHAHDWPVEARCRKCGEQFDACRAEMSARETLFPLHKADKTVCYLCDRKRLSALYMEPSSFSAALAAINRAFARLHGGRAGGSTSGPRQEISPWQENAIRHLEDWGQ